MELSSDRYAMRWFYVEYGKQDSNLGLLRNPAVMKRLRRKKRAQTMNTSWDKSCETQKVILIVWPNLEIRLFYTPASYWPTRQSKLMCWRQPEAHFQHGCTRTRRKWTNELEMGPLLEGSAETQWCVSAVHCGSAIPTSSLKFSKREKLNRNSQICASNGVYGNWKNFWIHKTRTKLGNSTKNFTS
jgi:hypothetical protein